MSRIRWTRRAVVVLLCVFTIEALSATIQLTIGGWAQGAPVSAFGIFTSNLWRAWLWAALTPVVFLAASRLRLDARPRWRAALLLTASGLALATLHVTLSTVWFYDRLGAAHGSYVAAWRYMASYLPHHFVVFITIVGAYYLIDYARTARDSRIAAAELAARAARLEASTSDARLQALRMELHPHFLANALNTVSGLVRAGDGPRALDVLSKIGDVLRRAYARTGHTTTVREEFEAVGEYLDIEQIRFSDRLSVATHIDPAVAAASVPTFILQPLVENAVRHGLGTSSGGRVEIAAHAADGGVLLSVTDNGKGIAEHAPEGIGLSNTRKRLRELYGDRGRVTIAPRVGGGTVATVEILL